MVFGAQLQVGLGARWLGICIDFGCRGIGSPKRRDDRSCGRGRTDHAASAEMVASAISIACCPAPPRTSRKTA